MEYMPPSIAHTPASDGYFEGILPVSMLLCFHIFHSAGAERLWNDNKKGMKNY